MKENSRNNGIELLRIVLMYMICMQHILIQGGVLANCIDGFSYKWYYFIKVFCYCAVGGYAIISGYVCNSKKLNIKKIIIFWIQTWFYSFVVSILADVILGNELKASAILSNFFPITNNIYWYSTAYIILLFFVPFINQGIDSFDTKQCNFMLIITIVFMSLAWFIKQENWLENCYSPLWIIIMYIVGHLLRKCNLFERINSFIIFLLFIILSLITYLEFIVFGTKLLFGRASITIVVSCVCLIVLFSRLSISSKIVEAVSPLTYGVYLSQCSKPIFYKLGDMFSFVCSYNVLYGTMIVLLAGLGLFVIGVTIEYTRKRIHKILRVDYYVEKVINKVTLLTSRNM